MRAKEARHRIHTRVEQWRAKFEQLRAERKAATGAARRKYIEQLRELQATVADEIREWNARIDAYDMDPTGTTQREFEEHQLRLRDIESQIKSEVALWLSESHDVG